MIRDRLKVAQSRQKSYAASKRKETVYETGDRVYLRVSPLRGVKRFGVKGKLAPRFVGPYKILQRMGEVGYKLELPEGLTGVHDVFHVSQWYLSHLCVALLQLRNVEYIMYFRQSFGQFQLVGHFSHTLQNSIWSYKSWC